MNEAVDRRILAAFRCIDAFTGESVMEPLLTSAGQWVLKPNRGGIFVVFDGPGLDFLTSEFVPTTNPWPAALFFEVTIEDPSLRYLPRRVTINAPISVPNNPSAAALQDPTTVFCPQRVAVFPTPAGATATNWSVVHASVVNADTKGGLPWCALRVTRNSDNAVIGIGVSDARGEALLAVPGLKAQVAQTGGGSVTQQTIAATVTAYFDPSVSTKPAGWVPNPDDILLDLSNPKFKSAAQAAQLAVGQELNLSFPIAV